MPVMNVFIFRDYTVVNRIKVTNFDEFVDQVLKMRLEPGEFSATVTTISGGEEFTFQITEANELTPQSIIVHGLRPKALKKIKR